MPRHALMTLCVMPQPNQALCVDLAGLLTAYSSFALEMWGSCWSTQGLNQGPIKPSNEPHNLQHYCVRCQTL
eukprot:1161213-Pelagomonas_calceolata.AAC.21